MNIHLNYSRGCFENNYHIKPSLCVRRRSRQNLNFGVFPQKAHFWVFWHFGHFWPFWQILPFPPISPISPILAIFAKTQFFAILAIFPILAIFDY